MHIDIDMDLRSDYFPETALRILTIFDTFSFLSAE